MAGSFFWSTVLSLAAVLCCATEGDSREIFPIPRGPGGIEDAVINFAVTGDNVLLTTRHHVYSLDHFGNIQWSLDFGNSISDIVATDDRFLVSQTSTVGVYSSHGEYLYDIVSPDSPAPLTNAIRNLALAQDDTVVVETLGSPDGQLVHYSLAGDILGSWPISDGEAEAIPLGSSSVYAFGHVFDTLAAPNFALPPPRTSTTFNPRYGEFASSLDTSAQDAQGNTYFISNDGIDKWSPSGEFLYTQYLPANDRSGPFENEIVAFEDRLWVLAGGQLATFDLSVGVPERTVRLMFDGPLLAEDYVPNFFGTAVDPTAIETTAETFVVDGDVGDETTLVFAFPHWHGSFRQTFGIFPLAAVTADPEEDAIAFATEAIGSAIVLVERSRPSTHLPFMKMPAGTELGFFVLPNSTVSQFLHDPESYFADPPEVSDATIPPVFSLSAANAADYDQMVAFDDGSRVLLSFEDLPLGIYRHAYVAHDFSDVVVLVRGIRAIPENFPLPALSILPMLVVVIARRCFGRNRSYDARPSVRLRPRAPTDEMRPSRRRRQPNPSPRPTD